MGGLRLILANQWQFLVLVFARPELLCLARLDLGLPKQHLWCHEHPPITARLCRGRVVSRLDVWYPSGRCGNWVDIWGATRIQTSKATAQTGKGRVATSLAVYESTLRHSKQNRARTDHSDCVSRGSLHSRFRSQACLRTAG